MTTRTKQFPATIPTGPLKTFQPKTEQPVTNPNPLSSFFRKSKLSLSLPSRGQWYPKSGLNYDSSGHLSVFAMNASDDIKFRTGDATMTGKNIYEVIQSCVPGITQPENIPHIDIDAILLAIRVASYGAEFDFQVSVPNTKLFKTIKVNAIDLLYNISNCEAQWDSEINIEDETGQTLSLEVNPIPLKNLFITSKNIFLLRRSLTKNIDQDENIKDESSFSTTMNSLSLSAIDLLCSSIGKLSINDPNNNTILSLDSTNPQDAVQINTTIRQIDIAYFNTIRDHIDKQREKYAFFSEPQNSSVEELHAGAPETWKAELVFMGSNFLPESKNA